ncbi:hypothetical protein REPUB_Repub01dG0001000 [Reevesia pubescens]
MDVESDDEEFIEQDDGIPFVNTSTVRKKSLRDPWRGEFELIDLGHGFYVVKFERMEDRFRVLTKGPWKIMDHYLTVQLWRPHFRPSAASIRSTTVWVHLPELPLEYFSEDVLLEIGKLIGKPLKVDSTATLATRGKFARIYVELNLHKPLVSKVRVGKYLQRVEYEGFHTVCFHCGIVGHCSDNCLEYITAKAATKQDRNMEGANKVTENGGDASDSGGT